MAKKLFLAVDSWQVAVDSWQVTVDSWQVAGGC